MSPRPIHRSQRGMTLIEVLVAMLVFSFGLLGLLGLQARAVQFSVSAEDTNRAALLANELASVIHTTGSATVADEALAAWKARVADPARDGLPNGDGDVAVADDIATITISWRAPSAKKDAADNRYVTQVMAPLPFTP